MSDVPQQDTKAQLWEMAEQQGRGDSRFLTPRSPPAAGWPLHRCTPTDTSVSLMVKEIQENNNSGTECMRCIYAHTSTSEIAHLGALLRVCILITSSCFLRKTFCSRCQEALFEHSNTQTSVARMKRGNCAMLPSACKTNICEVTRS